MNKVSIFLLLLLLFNVYMFSNITQDFEDENLLLWEMETAEHWQIYEQGGNHLLKHSFDNAGAGNDQVSLYYNVLDLEKSTASWQFSIQHGYNPSSSNNWAIFLMADNNYNQMHPGGSVNGYALGINIKNNDDLLTFYRVESGDFIAILTTSLNWQESVGVENFANIKINRSINGTWSVFIDTTISENNYNLIGEITDITFNKGIYFGIYYKYTSSQDMKLMFDNLNIDGYFENDTEKPFVKSLTIQNDTSVSLSFNEPVSKTSKEKASLNSEACDLTYTSGSGTILCSCNNSLKLTNSLSVSGFSDIANNQMNDTVVVFDYYTPVQYDIIITEIMASPLPSVGLPGVEYLEIFNRSGYEVNLNNWQLCINDKCKPFPDEQIKNNSYLVLCDIDDLTEFSEDLNKAGIENLYALTNDGATITLINNNEEIIHSVTYSPEMHSSAYKQEGGWSMEIIDTDYPCLDKENWNSSVDIKGGTPGAENSIKSANPDLNRPIIKRVSVINDSIIQVHFSEKMNSIELVKPGNYEVENYGNPENARFVWPDFSAVLLHFNQPFGHNIIYSLTVNSVLTDCSGNLLENSSCDFALPFYVDSNEIIINEILFNAGPTGTVFIEIYNKSVKTLNLDDIVIAIRENYTGELKNITEIDEKGILFFPGNYIAFTNNPENLATEYILKFPENIFKNKLPSLPNTEATIVICTKNMNIIDLIHYREEQHYSMLKNTQGVSLERINTETSSLDPTNWHSASSISGYATPGYINSQNNNIEGTNNELTIEPEVFSPDNDGFNDVLFIRLNFSENDFSGHIKIFDSRGRLTRNLCNNLLFGNDNTIIWDGTDNNGKIQSYGIYLIYIKVFSPSGKIKEYKKTCVLGGRFE